MRQRYPCRGKIGYVDRGAAEKAIDQLFERGLARIGEGILRAYWCQDCRAWHIGHTA